MNYHCPKCKSNHVWVGAMGIIRNCDTCGWNRHHDTPCDYCGEPSVGCLAAGHAMMNFCFYHCDDATNWWEHQIRGLISKAELGERRMSE